MLRMDYDNGEEQKKKEKRKESNQNKAQQSMETHIRIMRYLRIPPPQTRLTYINILTYINEKPHTSFENTLTKQRPRL